MCFHARTRALPSDVHRGIIRVTPRLQQTRRVFVIAIGIAVIAVAGIGVVAVVCYYYRRCYSLCPARR